MTQASTNFLTLVNKAIDESGSELATFTLTDFLTNTDPMMNRFKGWVSDAWTDIQQESFDWEWMSDQAVVTIKPGLMFYSDTTVGTATTFINPAIITDVNGSIITSGLQADQVQNLQLRYQTPKPFGAMALQYADYSLTNSHRLDFGLKAGGEMITRAGVNKFTLRAVVPANVVASATIVVGQVVTGLTVTDVTHSASTAFTLTNGAVSAYSVSGNYVTIDVQYDASSGDPWAKLRQYAVAQTGVTFSVSFTLAIVTASGSVNVTGNIQYPDTPNVPPYALAQPMSSITPLNYKIELDGNINAGIPPSLNVGDTITQWQFNVARPGNTVAYNIPCNMHVDALYSDPTVGLLKLTITDDSSQGNASVLITGSADSSRGTFAMSLFTWLMFTDCVALQGNFLSAIAEVDDDNGDPQIAAFVTMHTTTQVTTWTYTLVVPYVVKNWIHSWKSYDWNEENQSAEDFIGTTNVREVNQDTYKIVSRDDPGVAAEVALQFVPWSTFEGLYDLTSQLPGTPRLVTEDNMGRVRFYPPLDRPYTILFNYVREPMTLAFATDVPRGIPQEYVRMIVWKALMYYGKYDEQANVYSRAKQEYFNLLTRFQQSARPKFYFKSGFKSI